MRPQDGIESGAVREALARVYERPEFVQAERKTFLEVLTEWLRDWLGRAGAELPPWAGDVPKVFAALLALILVARIAGAARGWLRGRERAGVQAAPAALARSDAASHRRRAQEAAATGDYVAAVRALYLYAVARLDEQEWVRFHESKTGGDYLGEVARSERGETFRRFLEEVERVVFGGRPCGPERFAALSGLAESVADGAA